jgi:arsenite/tail-anchored protein-transporting ATPase
MAPRTILYTGKGGVGKTSVATATARRCAAAGARTIVLSTDPAHSLAESLETAIGGSPTDVGGGLFAQQIQAQDELERHWSGVQRWLGALLVERGVDRIAAEELTVPPGGDELFSLLALKEHHESGDWDVIVVDCAPTGETLRLLSFPDAAQWWLDKVLGRERALLAAARPLARTFLDMQLPDERAFGEIQRLVGNLVAMHDLLRDAEHASIRLVMTPDRMVVAEAMRTFTYLNLYGYVTDAVVVNRVFPDELDGTYFGAWRAVQAEQLELVESGFAPVPVLRAPYFEREVLGAEMLDRLAAALFDGRDAGAVLHGRVTQELSLRDGGAELRLDLPFVGKGDVSLKKIGLELVVRVDGHKRTILLPGAMAAYRPSSAALADGSLVVGFTEPEAARV